VNGIRFASPWWLLLALFVVARVALLVHDRRSGRGAMTFSSFSLLNRKSSVRAATSLTPFLIELAAILLLVVAMARPQRVIRLSANDRYGIDIVVALDASGSMEGEDFHPTRFAVAKQLISDFIERRQDDRIGIVTFGVRAATRAPITYDREIAQAMLNRARVGENGDGTAIGHAIATSVNRLRGSQARSRVIILVTDGVNNAGSIEPLTASALAAKYGIRIYAIGVGSRTEFPIRIKQLNRLTGEIEESYQMTRGDIDEETLSSIATQTGGAYFRATDAATMSTVLQRIDQLEKTRLNSPKSEKVDELYPLPLLAGLAFLLVSLVSGETLWLKVAA
jgi:Ca-activated chloride channel family protein